VMAEVATSHVPAPASMMARGTQAPAPRSSGPLATGRSITAAPGLPMPSYPLHAEAAPALPRPNSVAVPCPRPRAAVAAAAAPLPSPPGLEPACASARGLYGQAFGDAYYYNAMAYELECAFEQGRAYQRDAAAHVVPTTADHYAADHYAADHYAADHYAADYAAAAALGPQKLPAYASANELSPSLDPELPVKKRVSSFLAEASAGFTRSWDAEPASL